MYLAETKTLLRLAMSTVFDAGYPEADFRNLLVSLEYPSARESYPSIWVDFEPIGDLEQVGINHVEYITQTVNGVTSEVPTTRWRFGGFGTYTAVALTSLERDRLFDEVVRVFAFTKQHPATARYRDVIEHSSLIGMHIGWGKIGQRGLAATVGTPWGTDEILYEVTVAVPVNGEFVLAPVGSGFLLLSDIDVYEYNDREPDPTLGVHPENPWI